MKLVKSLTLAAVLVFGASLHSASAQGLQAVQPIQPPPDPAELEPGLAVTYWFQLFRHVDQLVDWQESKRGIRGQPLPSLNYRSGTGPVLSSRGTDGVGAEITGLIHLDKPGSYSFNIESNDGVRFWIGDEMLIEDPDVHADRFSDFGTIEVAEPGWYPVKLLYFERKNTSTLRLFWQPPGDSGGTMKIVPKEAFAHIPQG